MQWNDTISDIFMPTFAFLYCLFQTRGNVVRGRKKYVLPPIWRMLLTSSYRISIMLKRIVLTHPPVAFFNWWQQQTWENMKFDQQCHKVENRHMWEDCIHTVWPRSLIFDKHKQVVAMMCVSFEVWHSKWECVFSHAVWGVWVKKETAMCFMKSQQAQLPVW